MPFFPVRSKKVIHIKFMLFCGIKIGQVVDPGQGFRADGLDFTSGGQLQCGVNPNLTHFFTKFTKECIYERKR
jgi:hypothetical protein